MGRVDVALAFQEGKLTHPSLTSNYKRQRPDLRRTIATTTKKPEGKWSLARVTCLLALSKQAVERGKGKGEEIETKEGAEREIDVQPQTP